MSIAYKTYLLILALLLQSMVVIGQIYPMPEQLQKFYHVHYKTVGDSLIAHGYNHARTYSNTKNNYIRYVFTRDCKLDNESSNEGRATRESPDDALIVEICCNNDGIVEVAAIEMLTDDRYNYYMNRFASLGYNYMTSGFGFSPHRYPFLGMASVDRFDLHKKIVKKRIKDRLIEEPVIGNLCIDSYLFPERHGRRSFNIGVTKEMWKDPRACIGTDYYEDEKIIWDKENEERREREIIENWLEKLNYAKKSLPEQSTLLLESKQEGNYFICYWTSNSDKLTGKHKVYKLDVTKESNNPKVLFSMDRAWVQLSPDSVHLIIMAGFSQPTEHVRFVVVNLFTEQIEANIPGKVDRDFIYHKKRGEFEICSDKYIYFFDLNGKEISRKEKTEE